MSEKKRHSNRYPTTKSPKMLKIGPPTAAKNPVTKLNSLSKVPSDVEITINELDEATSVTSLEKTTEGRPSARWKKLRSTTRRSSATRRPSPTRAPRPSHIRKSSPTRKSSPLRKSSRRKSSLKKFADEAEEDEEPTELKNTDNPESSIMPQQAKLTEDKKPSESQNDAAPTDDLPFCESEENQENEYEMSVTQGEKMQVDTKASKGQDDIEQENCSESEEEQKSTQLQDNKDQNDCKEAEAAQDEKVQDKDSCTEVQELALKQLRNMKENCIQCLCPKKVKKLKKKCRESQEEQKPTWMDANSESQDSNDCQGKKKLAVCENEITFDDSNICKSDEDIKPPTPMETRIPFYDYTAERTRLEECHQWPTYYNEPFEYAPLRTYDDCYSGRMSCIPLPITHTDACCHNEPQLILYYDILSPQARSCLMLTNSLKLEVDMRYTDLYRGQQLTEDYLKINPVHTVPTLVHNDLVLTDSHTILIYLCDTFRCQLACQLYPSNYLTRLKIMNLLFFEAQVLYRRHSNFMTDIVRKEFANIDYAFHEKKILEAYESLNSFLQESKFLAGDTITIADISMVATVSGLDLMFPIVLYADMWPCLNNWFHYIRAMPIYCLNFTGVKKQKDMIEKFGKFEFPPTNAAAKS